MITNRPAIKKRLDLLESHIIPDETIYVIMYGDTVTHRYSCDNGFHEGLR